jgi:hypothetical protein
VVSLYGAISEAARSLAAFPTHSCSSKDIAWVSSRRCCRESHRVGAEDGNFDARKRFDTACNVGGERVLR